MLEPRSSGTLAPIALFAFKRPEHTRRTLEALARNPEFASSPLHVFCDGARHTREQPDVDAVRSLVVGWKHPNKHLMIAPANRGLARSIREGVNTLCASHGCVIVVEDDLIVSPNFLHYMNEALTRYRDVPEVMQVSGHNFPVDIPDAHDAVFLRLTTSWGWATWDRAWAKQSRDLDAAKDATRSISSRYAFDMDGAYPFSRMLRDQMNEKNDSWAIWWYLSVYRAGGLTLFPRRSLVYNDGFDGTGTHSGVKQMKPLAAPTGLIVNFPEVVQESIEGRHAVRKFLLRDRLWKKYLKDTVFRVLGSVA